MRLSIRKRIGKMRFSLVVGGITDVIGVNSNIGEDSHIIMWEFDDPDLTKIKQELWATQVFHSLPSIHISESHPGGGYHAYCLHQCTWMQSLHIVSGTRFVDPRFVTMCAMRNHWTLRQTSKGQGAPRFIETLESEIPETAKMEDLGSWVQYEVWPKKHTFDFGKRGL